jgi:hypothetical protein
MDHSMTRHQSRFALRLSLALVAALTPGASALAQGQPSQRVPDSEVEIVTFYSGEFDRPTFSLWGPRIGCADPEAYARTRCGGRRYAFKAVTDAVAGNKCGYRGYVAVCFR